MMEKESLEKIQGMVEELTVSDKSEVLGLFTDAFVEYPLHPAFGPKEIRRLMRTFFDFFGDKRAAKFYGIRIEGKIVCVSLSVDFTEKKRFLSLMQFILGFIRAIGLSLIRAVRWRMAKEFSKVHEQAPKYEENYLYVVFLATLPSFQKQGLGRRMLRFLYEKAKEEGYKGVILVTNKDNPAFRFYLKEGFIVDKEIGFTGVRLCQMRLVF